MRKLDAWREILRAASGSRAVLPAAVTGDRQRLTGLRSLWRYGQRRGLRAVDAEGREIPILVCLHDLGRRFEAVGEFDRDLSGRIAHDVPVAHHEAELPAGVDQRAAAVGDAVF